jgi:hypothetical protein
MVIRDMQITGDALLISAATIIGNLVPSPARPGNSKNKMQHETRT